MREEDTKSKPAPIPEMEFPAVFQDRLNYISSLYPDYVEYDPVDGSTIFKNELPKDVAVAVSYLGFTADVDDVISNLNIVIEDLWNLPSKDYQERDIQKRRYFLLTKLFFYELLRVRDVLGRHLKALEQHGFMQKEERRKTKKMLDEQLDEHYLIRNVFLHGHSMPKSQKEQELDAMLMAEKVGYDPEALKKEGQIVGFSETLRELCARRARGVAKIGVGVRDFLNSTNQATALWCHQKMKQDGEWEERVT